MTEPVGPVDGVERQCEGLPEATFEDVLRLIQRGLMTVEGARELGYAVPEGVSGNQDSVG